MVPHNVIVILGPTASGKSRLGVSLAKKFHGVVISADSRQVYRGLNIGTGKISRNEQQGVLHYLLDVASPKSQYSVSRYVRDVRQVLKKIPTSKPIFLVGGSPFYIKAVTEPQSFSSVPPNPTLRRRLEKMTTTQLIAELRRVEPTRVTTIDTANRRRLIRAIEIASAQKLKSQPVWPSLRVINIGLSVPRQTLFRRIDAQIAQRLHHGMIGETIALHRQGLSWKRIEALGLEYRVLVAYLRGRLSRPETEKQMRKVTHDFVRRQMTWWKREPDIQWITTKQHAIKLCRQFLLQTKQFG